MANRNITCLPTETARAFRRYDGEFNQGHTDGPRRP